MNRVHQRLIAIATGLCIAACGLQPYVPARGQASAETPAGELVKNGGFEEAGGQVPKGWTRDLDKTGDKGTVSMDGSRRHAGSASLRLQPNGRNGGEFPLALAQEIPAAGLFGKKIEFSAVLAAEGGAKAFVGMLSIVGGKPGNLVMLSHGGGEWVRQSQTYTVSADPSTRLFLTVWVDGKSGSAWFDDVSVAAGGAPVAREAPPAKALTASIEVDAAAPGRRIPRTLFGTNMEWRWNATYMWNEKAMKPDAEGTRLTRDLGVTLIRYPGGIYSDFYHWRDGIGPFDKRPQVVHEPGREDKSRPNFGTDEALAFAEQVGAELMITVNAGTGTAKEAADWVRYVNGKTLRVRYWEVGNELYIKDGSPVSRASTIDPETYARRFREFAAAMRAADPRILIGAIGGENQGRYAVVGYPNWNRTVFEKAGDQIDFLSVHNAYAPLIGDDDEKKRDLRTIYRAMVAAPANIARNLQTLARQIDQYAPGREGRKPFIAVTEWAPVFQWEHKGRYVDHPKTLGSALFAASAMKVFLESPQTQMANFWMLNDFSVLGWIGSRNGDFPPNPQWAPTARYYAFQMFSRHFGDQLVRYRADGPTFDSETVGLTEGVKSVPYLDVIASQSADGRNLYILAINRHFDSPIDATISVSGFRPKKDGTVVSLTGSGIDANTGTQVIRVPGLVWGNQVEDSQHRRFHRGSPEDVVFASRSLDVFAEKFAYRFPPHSVTSLVLVKR